MEKNLLLIIDPQNDFCLPNGTLSVPGAEEDMARLAAFIAKNRVSINEIIVSVDTHHVLDISHPYYWKNNTGETPTPYTQITYKDIEEEKWIPCFHKEKTIQYLKELEKQGEFPHIIWPEHCIVGSTGAAVVDVLMDEMKNWERKTGKHFTIVEKGLNDSTEMFGVFRANIPDPTDKQTMVNTTLIQQIAEYDTVYIAGEAKSHCVANSIKQLFAYPNIMKKLVILEDCMSNVAGFDTIALPIYEEATKMGAKFVKSTDL